MASYSRAKERETEREHELVNEAEPSVSPTLWPTERSLRESAPGRHPEQDPTLPNIQTHLQSIVAVTRSEPDPHFHFALCVLYLSCLSTIFKPFHLFLYICCPLGNTATVILPILYLHSRSVFSHVAQPTTTKIYILENPRCSTAGQ